MAWPSRWPDGIVADEVVTASWLDDVSKSFTHLEEVAYAEFTADVSVTATTVGTANQIVSAGAVTFEAVPHMIEVWISRIDAGTQTHFVILRDVTTVLGTLTWIPLSTVASGVHLMRRITPTAASHTYNVAGWNNAASTTTVQSGTGGAAGDAAAALPGFIRIWRVPV
jgi:hypothetical protein